MISLKNLYEKLSPDVKVKVGDKVMGDPKAALPMPIKNAIAKLAKLQGLTPKQMDEPNTKWEDDLIGALGSWVDQSEDDVAKFFKKNYNTFLQLAKEYPQLFVPPMNVLVYRGTKLSTSTIAKLLSKVSFEKHQVVKVGSKSFIKLDNVKYTPNRPSQSWTLDLKVALRFVDEPDQLKMGCILVGKTDSSFIFSPDLMSVFFTRKKDEKETVRVGNEGTFTLYLPFDQLSELRTLHKLPQAKGIFDKVVDEYNEFVKEGNAAISKYLKGKGITDPTKMKQAVGQLRDKYNNPLIRVVDVGKNWEDNRDFSAKKDQFPMPTIKSIDEIDKYYYEWRDPTNDDPLEGVHSFDFWSEYGFVARRFVKDLTKRKI